MKINNITLGRELVSTGIIFFKMLSLLNNVNDSKLLRNPQIQDSAVIKH